jgi:putative flippase GtrA
VSEFLRFALIGTLGFVVDASCLLVFVGVGATPLGGRIASFLIAATVTFVLNHRFTFRMTQGPTVQGWTYYVALTAVGALLNLAIYQLWIGRAGTSAVQLVVGAALGSVTAMCLNFAVSRALIFSRNSRK